MEESFPCDLRFDTVAPLYIHDSGSAVKQMSAEIYGDYVDTYWDMSRVESLYTILEQNHFSMDSNGARFRTVVTAIVATVYIQMAVL